MNPLDQALEALTKIAHFEYPRLPGGDYARGKSDWINDTFLWELYRAIEKAYLDRLTEHGDATRVVESQWNRLKEG